MPRPLTLTLAGGVLLSATVFLAAALRTPVDDVADPDAQPTPAASVEPPPAAAAPATASAAPPSPVEAAPTPSAPSVYEQRSRFLLDLRTGHLTDATAGLENLVAGDAPSLEDPDVRGGILDLALRLAVVGGRDADHVFDLVANRTGTRGPDLLFAMVTTKGGSRAAKRAEDMLRDEPLRDRGTPALRIAYDLRATRCGDKPSLFDRAAAEGDGRTLGQLTMLNQDCRRGWRRTTDCCFPRDPALVAAIEALRTRVR